MSSGVSSDLLCLRHVKLHNELFLHSFRRRIGPQDLARIRSLVIAAFRVTVGSWLATQLPKSLKNLYFEGEGIPLFRITHPKAVSAMAALKPLSMVCADASWIPA